MANELWALRVDIFKKGHLQAPVVRHIFYGNSKESVQRGLEGHMQHDEFLASCVKKGKYADFEAEVVMKLEKAVWTKERKSNG